MSEYWEILLAMTVFFLLILMTISKFWKEVEGRLTRIEEKIDSMGTSNERVL